MKTLVLVGPSGCGKSTIARELDGNIIQSYTTRKPRFEGERGHTFISDFKIKGQYIEFKNNGGYELINNNEIVAYVKLYGEHYFSLYKQFKHDELNIYILNPSSIWMVEDYLDDVVVIYLSVCESVREERGLDRYGSRLEEDSEEFRKCKCNWVVDNNRPLNDVLKDIRGILK